MRAENYGPSAQLRAPAIDKDYRKLILAIVEGGVDFIIVGGVAVIMHGSARATFDLDLVYAQDEKNIRDLVQALKPHSPYLRDAPEGLPF